MYTRQKQKGIEERNKETRKKNGMVVKVLQTRKRKKISTHRKETEKGAKKGEKTK